MVKIILYIVFLLSLILSHAQELEKLRLEFPYIDEQKTSVFYDNIVKESSDLAILYKGALYFYKSKYVDSPLQKYKFFKKGKALVDEACSKQPKDIEYRYIRLVFQHKLPDFLGYNKNKKSDLEFFIKKYPEATHNHKKKMLENLMEIEEIRITLAKHLKDLS
jgi:hypothetical protein